MARLNNSILFHFPFDTGLNGIWTTFGSDLTLTLELCYIIIIHGMLTPIDEIVKRKVIQQWLAGEV